MPSGRVSKSSLYSIVQTFQQVRIAKKTVAKRDSSVHTCWSIGEQSNDSLLPAAAPEHNRAHDGTVENAMVMCEERAGASADVRRNGNADDSEFAKRSRVRISNTGGVMLNRIQDRQDLNG